jgi:septum formation protein
MCEVFCATWAQPEKNIILASSSPRRRDLLKRIGISFETVEPRVENENAFLEVADIETSLKRLAVEKARSVSRNNPQALVLGADTIVWSDGKVLGKPRDAAEARSMLLMLSGVRHTVYSAISLLCEAESFLESAVAKTDVFFRKINEREIDTYIDCGEYIDKAGGYGIQGRAMIFVTGIEGCYYNVVGLPIVKTISLFNAYMTRKERSNG